MNRWQEIKNELKKQGKTAARYFDKKTLETYERDRAMVAERMNAGATNADAWNGAGIYQTRFYNENGCGYCLFLEIVNGLRGAQTRA